MLVNQNGLTFVHTGNMASMARDTATKLERLGINSVSLIPVNVTPFESGEVKPYIAGNVRHKDIFLFHDFNGEVHSALWTCLLTIQALELAGVRSITMVMPYIPYLRQDRKEGSRVPISASLFISLIKQFRKVERVITTHMHCDQAEMVFGALPVLAFDHLPGRVIWRDFAKLRLADKMDQLLIVDPDGGNPKEAKLLATELGLPENRVSAINQTRSDGNKKVFSIVGLNVRGMTCLLVDDIIDTASTLSNAIDALFSMGAAEVIAGGTHAGFNPKGDTTAYEKLAKTGATVVVTDSMETESHSWLCYMPLSPYLAHIIYQNVTDDGSVSELIRTGLVT
jgi:ribose-phosphate pyrophosphokinase